MGSPNFFTNGLLVVGIEACNADEQDFEDFTGLFELSDTVEEQVKEINRSLVFFSLRHQLGYHSGFQVYIDQDAAPATVFNEYAKYWAAGDAVGVYDCAGSLHEINDEALVQAAQDGTLTVEQLVAYMAQEQATVTSLLKSLALQHGLGEVIGRSWTSSVDYSWLQNDVAV